MKDWQTRAMGNVAFSGFNDPEDIRIVGFLVSKDECVGKLPSDILSEIIDEKNRHAGPEGIPFVDRLELAISSNGYTKSVFAEMLGISRQHLNNNISFDREPRLEMIAKYAHMLPRTDLFWLITGKISE